MRQSQLSFSNCILSPHRSTITSIPVVHIMYLPLTPLIPPFWSFPPVNLNSNPLFKCRLYLGRCPCCTSCSPILPHLMMVVLLSHVAQNTRLHHHIFDALCTISLDFSFLLFRFTVTVPRPEASFII
jgi:hypothetical protein